jgi:transposase-like protein
MRTIRQVRRKKNGPRLVKPSVEEAAVPALDARLAAIQALIPLGLQAVAEELDAEVTRLAGPRYAREDGQPAHVRWGRQAGSIYLADQKLGLAVPRVRDRDRGLEVPLATYAAFQQPRALDEGLFRRVLGGLSQREYAACAEAVPKAFGLSRSTVSRRFVRASTRHLTALQERRLDAEWVALFLDGKRFAEDGLVIAVGVTVTGVKQILGFVQTATENRRSCAAFLRGLVERRFEPTDGLLVVLDGAKGLRAAVEDVWGARAQVQRCQWHKRENVVSHLPKRLQPEWRQKLQRAYAQPTYAAAKTALQRCQRELRLLNASAAASLLEGLEETLTLHRLGLGALLGASFRTTNVVESVMAQVEQRTGKVDHWRTSDQKQRWCAAALLQIEPRLRKVKGYQALTQLVQALKVTQVRARDAA